MNLEEKILNMKPSEIIMVMVRSLLYPKIALDFDNYGTITEGVLEGCAATNVFAFLNPDIRIQAEARLSYTGIDDYAVTLKYRNIWDDLRAGQDYSSCVNTTLEKLGMPEIQYTPDLAERLPFLSSNFIDADQTERKKLLKPYFDLAVYNHKLEKQKT